MIETASFYASKIFWGLLAPSHLLVLLLFLSFTVRLPQTVKDALHGFIALYLLVCLFLPLGDWFSLPLEQCYASAATPQKIDGYVVLGGAVDAKITRARDMPAFNSAADRVISLVKILHDSPEAKVVYTGGSGSAQHPDFDEATTIRNYLRDIGVGTNNLIIENGSHNTYENAVNTVGLLRSGAEQHWYLVTSAQHLPRAMALFEKAGKEQQIFFHPYPVDYRTIGRFQLTDTGFDLPDTLEKIDSASKEYLGLVMNKLLGKSNVYWPCNRPVPKATL